MNIDLRDQVRFINNQIDYSEKFDSDFQFIHDYIVQVLKTYHMREYNTYEQTYYRSSNLIPLLLKRINKVQKTSSEETELELYLNIVRNDLVSRRLVIPTNQTHSTHTISFVSLDGNHSAPVPMRNPQDHQNNKTDSGMQ